MKRKDFEINIYITNKESLTDFLKPIISKEFEWSDAIITKYLDNEITGLESHLTNLIDSCYFVIETNYVDKVYRDSYYHYFSSKHYPYKKNCIRLSIFNGEVTRDHFRSPSLIQMVEKFYLGFIVLRPTEPLIIGRSFISPKALKDNNFFTCSTKISSTVHSIKMKIEGFPHSSQDNETLSCAETTIWSMMDFFGSKYSQYKSILPSDIIKTLNKVSIERQIPSRGLSVEKISFALKEFDFGTIIYSRKEYDPIFENLLSCYIESGIPLILALESRVDKIGHAVLCIGFKPRELYMYEAIRPSIFINDKTKKVANSKGIKIFDNDDIRRKFVIMDDNLPAYSLALLNTPCQNYNFEKFPAMHNCTVTHFLVPLYPKIYLEAFQVKIFIRSFLVEGLMPLNDNSEVYLRTFLTTNRSYKNYIVSSELSPAGIKEDLLKLLMPKFIWVTEISTREQMKKNPSTANGLIILDATEYNTNNNKAVIFAAHSDQYLRYSDELNAFEVFDIPLTTFAIYNNLINYT